MKTINLRPVVWLAMPFVLAAVGLARADESDQGSNANANTASESTVAESVAPDDATAGDATDNDASLGNSEREERSNMRRRGDRPRRPRREGGNEPSAQRRQRPGPDGGARGRMGRPGGPPDWRRTPRGRGPGAGPWVERGRERRSDERRGPQMSRRNRNPDDVRGRRQLAERPTSRRPGPPAPSFRRDPSFRPDMRPRGGEEFREFRREIGELRKSIDELQRQLRSA